MTLKKDFLQVINEKDDFILSIVFERYVSTVFIAGIGNETQHSLDEIF